MLVCSTLALSAVRLTSSSCSFNPLIVRSVREISSHIALDVIRAAQKSVRCFLRFLEFIVLTYPVGRRPLP